MAHEISVNSIGQTEAVFGYGEIPWWDSKKYPATVLNTAVSFDDVFNIAFPWEAIAEQLQYADGSLSSQYGLRRSDTLAELGVHSGSYGAIQPRKLFDFCSAFFEHTQVPIASAISMRGGKVLNISAKCGEMDILDSGDIHKMYLCFVNSFDGTMKAQVYTSTIQPVCMNTTRYGLAVADFDMTYKHTRNVEKRIEADIAKVQDLITAQALSYQELKTTLETLAKRRISQETYEQALNAWFGDSNSTRAVNTKRAFTEVVVNGTNATAFPDFRGTAYGLYTALTDWLDHHRVVRATNGRNGISDTQIRAEGALIGRVGESKQEALKLLMQLTNGQSEEVVHYSLPVDQRSLLDSIIGHGRVDVRVPTVDMGN